MGGMVHRYSKTQIAEARGSAVFVQPSLAAGRAQGFSWEKLLRSEQTLAEDSVLPAEGRQAESQ